MLLFICPLLWECVRDRERERERDFIVAYIPNRTMIHGWLWLLTNIALPYLGIAPENERMAASLCSAMCFLLPWVATCDPSIPADLFSTTNMMFPHLCSTSLHSLSLDEKKTSLIWVIWLTAWHLYYFSSCQSSKTIYALTVYCCSHKPTRNIASWHQSCLLLSLYMQEIVKTSCTWLCIIFTAFPPSERSCAVQ